MASSALLSIQDGMITYGKTPLFENLTFHIHAGSKIALVGNNGAGKTTLMQAITGKRELDAGERWKSTGLTIGYLQQEVSHDPKQTVFAFVRAGLSKAQRAEESDYLVDMYMEPLSLNPDDTMGMLSGGQLRRAALARSLVEAPDLLMLDEPTNHLDLAGIEWLEDFLKFYPGTLLCVSHDRAFLATVSDKVFWLDRGMIRVCPEGFGHFEEWSTMLLEQESRELQNRSSTLAMELEWAARGVKARRKRNVRRLELIHAEREKLKADKSRYRQATQKVQIETLDATESSRNVARFHNVCHAYGDKVIMKDFNLRIMKGDRIGLLGNNGSGKSTFLKILIKQLIPDSGTIKLAHTLEISYFDQNRSELNSSHTLRRTLSPSGGDYIEVGGKTRHVCSYLKDFMFDPRDSESKVSTLSGGQRNRLMLAKILAAPGGLLILDEPTNDLDMETMDMLEEMISSYKGTLVIVSHDRDFLDQTATQIFAFEGDGVIEHCIGGYSDYIAQKNRAESSKKEASIKPEKSAKKPQGKIQSAPKKPAKLSYKHKLELEELPLKISSLEEDLKQWEVQLADGDFYMRDAEGFDKLSRKHAQGKEKISQMEIRWLELEEMQALNEDV